MSTLLPVEDKSDKRNQTDHKRPRWTAGLEDSTQMNTGYMIKQTHRSGNYLRLSLELFLVKKTGNADGEAVPQYEPKRLKP